MAGAVVEVDIERFLTVVSATAVTGVIGNEEVWNCIAVEIAEISVLENAPSRGNLLCQRECGIALVQINQCRLAGDHEVGLPSLLRSAASSRKGGTFTVKEDCALKVAVAVEICCLNMSGSCSSGNILRIAELSVAGTVDGDRIALKPGGDDVGASVMVDIVGKSLDDARRALAGRHLQVGNVQQQPIAGGSRDIVLQEFPIAGQKIQSGSTVDLMVSDPSESPGARSGLPVCGICLIQREIEFKHVGSRFSEETELAPLRVAAYHC